MGAGISVSNTEVLFGELFRFLDEVGYLWQPQVPEQLLKSRAQSGMNPKSFSALSQVFGLGMQTETEELKKELKALKFPCFLFPMVRELRLAVSRTGSYFVPHSHWPAEVEHAQDYVHFGQESLLFMHQIYRYWDQFIGKRVLDLGCSSGGLAIELSQVSAEVFGVDASTRAIDWATASAKAQRCGNVRFQQGTIGRDSSMELWPQSKTWDVAVFNPPLAIARKTQSLPHRDGGKFGLELPLLFLDFAEKHLNPDGKVFCLMTNPVCHGVSLLFEQLKLRRWILRDQVCLNRRFNHQLYEADDYLGQGIERVELYFLLLCKC